MKKEQHLEREISEVHSKGNRENMFARVKKTLPGQLEKRKEGIRGKVTWNWLKSNIFKKETENTIIAVYNHANNRNKIRKQRRYVQNM